ncbi:MAG: phenylacetic acid degradation protein PaaY [Arenicella sp.]|nr:phenylacetic acid degradation protein PaaY [Arenicella sp.]
MTIYSLNGVTPVIEDGAFVHPDAIIIGDVFIMSGAFVAPMATMRGDFGRLILGQGANLQEHCCMHGFPGTDTIVEENGHIGHGAILHGCTIRKNALIGMNSTILDNATVGENSIIGAGSLLASKTNIPANSLAVGSPAKVIRELRDDEIKWKSEGTRQYHMLTSIYQRGMVETHAETIADFDRPRLTHSDYTHKN